MKKLIGVLALVVILVSAAACSASQEAAGGKVESEAYYSGIDLGKGTTVTTTTMVVPQTMVPSVDGASSAGGEESIGERMIIRTGNMSLVVVDVSAAVAQITTLATTYDGFVVSSSVWQDRDRMVGSIAIRVAVERFDSAISALGAMAVEVTSESTSGQDVTGEYVDLEASLRNLEASETQLLRLMEEETQSVSDILEVQRELVKTRGQIEQTKGRMQYLEQSSAMSLIQVQLEQSKLTVEFSAGTRNIKEGESVRFYPTIAGGFTPYSYEWDFGDGSTSTEEMPAHSYKSDGKYTVGLKVTDDRANTDSYERVDYITVLPGWNAGSIASGAWNGMVGFGRGLANVFIWLGIFSPVWIIIGVIVYFAWWRRRKKA